MPNTNEELVQELIRDGYLKSPPLIEAFRKIDRKDFIPRELWGEAYGNYPLPIGEGQTISQPLTVAFMLELLDPRPREKILDVGAGSGWTSALLAYCVSKSQIANSKSPSDKRCAISDKRALVVAVERIPGLCKIGEKNVRKYNFVEKGVVKFFCGDASKGVPCVSKSQIANSKSPIECFDKILAGASADRIPEAWKEQLKVGGRIVAPVGMSVVVLDKIPKDKFSARGPLRRSASEASGPASSWKTKEHFGFSFVPLVPEH